MSGKRPATKYPYIGLEVESTAQDDEESSPLTNNEFDNLKRKKEARESLVRSTMNQLEQLVESPAVRNSDPALRALAIGLLPTNSPLRKDMDHAVRVLEAYLLYSQSGGSRRKK